MAGDITRNTFDPTKHFTNLRKQQGRVDLDSDFNEAMDILLHHQRTVASDLIGQHGTPPVADGSGGGFHIQMNGAEDFHIGRGRYYVDGILCENEGRINADGILVDITYLTQPDYPQASPLPASPFMVYLKVWERHVTSLEDDYIREKALGGPDTGSRDKVIWQVKVANELPNGQRLPNDATCEFVKQNWSTWVETWQAEQRGLLKAITGDASEADLDNPCITPPKAGYRGAENQLYRVEIHTGGTAGTATFKWSRDNGSMTFPVTRLAGGNITLGYLGRDSRHSLEPGQWIELVDDTLALREEVRPLGKVTAVDREQKIVTVDWPQNADLPAYDSEEEYKSKHVLLRRWDHTDRDSVPGSPDLDAATGTLFIEESADGSSDNWLTLENGIRISFTRAASGDHQYYTGDYWLIPARTATGDVEWPWERDPSGELVTRNNRPVPEKRPPHGVERHYAPLAVILTADQQASDQNSDCRRKIVSVIDQDTDLQVHDVEVTGNLSVTGDVTGITPAHIQALAVDDYDLRRTGMQVVNFTAEDADGAPRTVDIGFQPALVLANAVGKFTAGLLVAGGTASGIVSLREGLLVAQCSTLEIARFSSSDVRYSSQIALNLFSGTFVDNSLAGPLSAGETILIDITAVSSVGFTLTLKRLPFGHRSRLQGFLVGLSLCCLG